MGDSPQRRVQHLFGGMQERGKNGGKMWDERNFNGKMRDENTSVEEGFAHFDRWDVIKIDDRMWDGKQKNYQTLWMLHEELQQLI